MTASREVADTRYPPSFAINILGASAAGAEASQISIPSISLICALNGGSSAGVPPRFFASSAFALSDVSAISFSDMADAATDTLSNCAGGLKSSAEAEVDEDSIAAKTAFRVSGESPRESISGCMSFL